MIEPSSILIKDAVTNQGRGVEGVIAGLMLLLAAVAAGFMVWTRLEGQFDQPTLEEALRAIDENSIWVTYHGVARIWFGASLIFASVFVGLALNPFGGTGLTLAQWLFVLGGIAMIVSGVLTTLSPAVVQSNDVFGLTDPESFYDLRRIAGSVGNTAIGAALICITRTQWGLRGLMRFSALIAPLVGIGMVVVWLDAAAVTHRVSGAGFGIWMVTTAVALILGSLRYQPSTAKNSVDAHRLRV